MFPFSESSNFFKMRIMVAGISALILSSNPIIAENQSDSYPPAIDIYPDFHRNFEDSTLRMDYIFGGGPDGIHILLDRQTKLEGWAGRRNRLEDVPAKGNGTISLIDPESGDTLYSNSFSTLFLEWLTTPESETANLSFENTFLLPLPSREAIVTVELRDNRQKPIAVSRHSYSPSEVLTRKSNLPPLPHEYVHKGGDPDNTIDVAMLAEGFSDDEMDKFLAHAGKIAGEILAYEPFASHKDKFNFVAVKSPSIESGVSIPHKDIWKETAFESHFDTFHSQRYLTLPRVFRLHDALRGIPYEHVIVIVNTEEYGGGGIYNNYQIAAAENKFALPVAVHEFGHSFAGLADEYFYAGEEDETYPLDVEPWEANITTLNDFGSKWENMIDPSTPIPTPWDKETPATSTVGLYEGGGYKSNGVYRPTVTCRMRDNYYPTFCPVCERELERVIEFYTE